jgi:hypothetical protein
MEVAELDRLIEAKRAECKTIFGPQNRFVALQRLRSLIIQRAETASKEQTASP